MITEEKIKEIKKQLRNGVPAGEIREKLISDGYSKKDIDQCFEVKKPDMRSWFLFAALAFILAGLWAWKQPENTAFHGQQWKAFILSAGLLIKYWWPEQKKKDEENI
ncbi:MAG: hypothetical protein QM737_05490 [Ferruginibacter sp.]